MNRLTTFIGARPGRGRKSGTNLLRVAGALENSLHGEMARVSSLNFIVVIYKQNRF